ncbi:MAG: hypothetical protein WDZ35_12345 [Crocinitomicaceae bacterium]
MTDKEYSIESTTLGYTAGFKGEEVYVSFVGTVKSCSINQVSEVIIKNTPMSGGDELSFRIIYKDGEKERKFNWVQGKVNNPTTQGFLNDLQERLASDVSWADKRQAKTVDEEGNHVYDLQYLPFGYAGAGLNRSLQIWIYMICLAVLVIPLIYYIYLLAKGGYRIYTNDNGLTIRKTKDTFYKWSELKGVEITRVNVVDRNSSYSSTSVLKIIFLSDTVKNKSVVMRYDHALPLIKELGERGAISQKLVDQFT